MRVSLSIEIARPPAAVFPWIAEPLRAMQWQKNVRGGEVIAETPERVGTTFREVLEEDGRSLEMQGQITHYGQDERIGFRLESKIHRVDVTYSLGEVSGATVLSVEAEIRWRFPMSVAVLFMGGKIEEGLRGQLSSELEDLRRLCENA